jgi:peptidoglycan/LPS O-acetylase OafA/YrhL
VTGLLLLVIGLASPWVVHIAPPRQRPLALVGLVILVLIVWIFLANPFTAWQTWAGLAAGVVSILVLSAMGGGGGGAAPRRRRSTSAARRRGRDHEDLTGEI